MKKNRSAEEEELRVRLIKLIKGEGAHANIEVALEKLSLKYYGANIDNVPYTIWQILEHLRMTQEDILEYIKNPDYEEKAWPEEYWPEEKAPSSTRRVKQSLEAYKKDLTDLVQLIKDPRVKILLPIPHLKKKKHTLLRELFLVADHTAYHVGQIILMRRLLGVWKD
jgi:uncharacterized damage-inducible protein DinB